MGGRRLARFNRRVTNPTALRLGAGRSGPYSLVVHTGRRSGRTHRTPVVSFRVDDGWLVALPYGPETDWVKNLMASGEGEVHDRGQQVRVTSPEVVQPAELPRAVPAITRGIFRIMGVSQFIHLSADTRPVEEAGDVERVAGSEPA